LLSTLSTMSHLQSSIYNSYLCTTMRVRLTNSSKDPPGHWNGDLTGSTHHTSVRWTSQGQNLIAVYRSLQLRAAFEQSITIDQINCSISLNGPIYCPHICETTIDVARAFVPVFWELQFATRHTIFSERRSSRTYFRGKELRYSDHPASQYLCIS
jgi:hypothetical protein